MKLFIKELFIFLAIYIGANITLHFSLPKNRFWGNVEYSKKIKEFSKGNYNTVFFGSSRILSGINPHQFDRLVNQNKNYDFKSYNLATPGTWANETFYLYEQFLDDINRVDSVGVVFMEFQNIMAIRPDKLTTDKAIYYQNFDNLTFITKYAAEEIRSSIKNTPSSFFYFTTYSLTTLENLLNIGRINASETPFDSLAYHGTDSRGFLGLSRNLYNRNAMNQKALENYEKNISSHLNQISRPYNRTFYSKIEGLIRESEKRGIKLIFILPPVRLTEGMMNVFKAIPNDHKIEICDPQKFPELYNMNHWIDETHLNVDGSVYFSHYLTEEYLKLDREHIRL